MTRFEMLKENKKELAMLLNAVDANCELCDVDTSVQGCKVNCLDKYLEYLDKEYKE